MATNNTMNSSVRTAQKDDFIRLQDLFYLCLAKWYWIVISLVITIGIALVYLLTTPPSYTRSASILIKEDAKGRHQLHLCRHGTVPVEHQREQRTHFAPFTRSHA